MRNTQDNPTQDNPMTEWTHFDDSGAARMVDVSDKPVSQRQATARGRIDMQPATLEKIKAGQIGKGDVFGVARLAAIMAAKKVGDLIPLCHPLGLDSADIAFETDDTGVIITATCRIHGRTGVEMEAMTAVSIAALTIYDMCKAIDRAMCIGTLRLTHKSGGRSGDYRAKKI